MPTVVKPVPPPTGNVEWVTTMSADKTSLSVLMVNTNNRKIEMPIALNGFAFAGEPVVKSVTIANEHVHSHLVPGERPLWKVGEEKLARLEGDRAVLPIGPNTVQSVTIPISAQ